MQCGLATLFVQSGCLYTIDQIQLCNFPIIVVRVRIVFGLQTVDLSCISFSAVRYSAIVARHFGAEPSSSPVLASVPLRRKIPHRSVSPAVPSVIRPNASVLSRLRFFQKRNQGDRRRFSPNSTTPE